MAAFDIPAVSVENKTNEDNIQAFKAWAYETIEQLNYYISNLEERISILENAYKERG